MSVHPLSDDAAEKTTMVGINSKDKKTKEEMNDVPEQVRNLVGGILENIQESENAFASTWEQMDRNMFLVRHGRDEYTPSNFYVANIAHRYIQSRTAALYARNPKIEAKPKKRLRYQLWDGDPSSIEMTIARMQAAAQQGIMPDQQDIALIKDYQSGKARENSIAQVGKTMEILFEYFTNEVEPDFKTQLKQVIKRMLTNYVGYVKVDYQRELGVKNNNEIANLNDHRTKMKHIERLIREVTEGDKVKEGDAELEELRLSLLALQEQEEIIIREGLTFDFPASNSVIVDPKCTQLKGFVNADWVAYRMCMSMEKASEVYEIDLEEAGASTFKKERSVEDIFNEEDQENSLTEETEFVKIYEYYHKPSGLMYTVTPGYKDFLCEPKPPNVELQRFFPIFSLVPNEIENCDNIYGSSDIELIAPMQTELNKSRQGLSEHRRFARPKIAYVEGSLEETDIDLLRHHPAFSVLPMKGLIAGQSINDLLQPIQSPGVDPNLYQTNHITEDMELVLGMSEAQLGATKGNISATQSSIAQSAGSTTLSSHTDEIDDFLSDIARACGEILLKEMSLEQVRKIVGQGAVWPELSQSEIQDEMVLGIQAGSSGKPNSAAELGNLERVMPFLLQLPGLKAKKVAQTVLEKLDSKLNIEDYFEDGLPSIIAQNQGAQLSTGDAGSDPNQQGVQGANPIQRLPQGDGALGVISQ